MSYMQCFICNKEVNTPPLYTINSTRVIHFHIIPANEIDAVNWIEPIGRYHLCEEHKNTRVGYEDLLAKHYTRNN